MAELTPAQQAFVDRYAPYANLASQQLGLPSRVILAKIALETGYGEHFANNNLPGLKTGNAAQNDGLGSAQTKTWEDYGAAGKTNIKDGFIKFPTPEQSIGGLVPWLSNSTYMNSLADRQGGGIFDRDPAAEASAVKALGSSGFSTDRNASAGVTGILDKLPDLSGYGIAPSFTPSIGQLMNYVPYNSATGMPNVSRGTGDLASNDYWSGEAYQSQGRVLSREKGASGLELPSPRMSAPSQAYSALDEISNGLSGGLRTAANAVGQAFVDATGRLPTADEFGARVDALKSGATNAVDQIAGIFGSTEAKAAGAQSGVDLNRYAIDDIYRLGLGRGVDDAGLTSNLAVLNQGGSLNSIAANLAGSQEGQTYALNDFYQNAFGRQADSPGLQDALAKLQAGVPLQQLETMLLQSPEAQERGITPDQFASILTPNYLSPVPTGNPIQTPDPITGSPSGGTPLQPVPTGNPIATPDPLTGDFSGSPLSPVATGNPIATPDPITANFGAPLSPVSTGPNVSQGVGAGSFQGTFDPAAYLAANPDVAAAHVDPLSHYLTSGYKEGRALDTQGDRINQGFDPSRYLAANPDVAAAGMNPLQHYLQFGAHEGRSTNFSGNVSPASFGAGITPNGPTEVSAQPPQSLADMITSAYQADLHRAPDAAAFQAAYDGISSGQDTFGQFQARMAASPEAQSFRSQGVNAPMLNTATPVSMQQPQSLAEMINATYQAQLQRQGEDGSVRDEADAISSGRDTFEAFQARMQASPEAQMLRGEGVNAPMLNTAVPVGTQGPAGSETTTAFDGRFDPNAYLAANADVKASGMDPLTHYLTYGFKEGRALDQAGDRINQGFDPSKYLAANPDVAQSGMDPLSHYLRFGAAEGRAAPTGSNLYQFSNYNVAQGAGATGNGSFGLGGITSPGGVGAPAPAAPALPDMSGGFNVSGGVQNGGFGLGGITSGSIGLGGISNPFGFSSANVGGGLGATAQSFGSLYPAGNSQPAAGGVDPYGFSSANVSGFNPNSSAAPVEDFGSGAGLGPTQWNDAPQAGGGDGGGGISGFNPQASELAFLRGQMEDQVTRDQASLNSGATAAALVNMGNQSAANLNAVGASNAAKQFAGIQAGLGITPVFASSLYTPPPLNFGPIGPVLGPMRGFL